MSISIPVFRYQVFSIEFQRLKDRHETKEGLMQFMVGKGYKNRSNVTSTTGRVNDFVFVKDGYLEHVDLFNVHNGVVYRGALP